MDSSFKYPKLDLDRHTKYLNVLAKIAADIPSPIRSNARHAACVVIQNDIVAFGVNEMKSHPFQAKFSKNKEAVYLHAETSAIKNALKYVSVDDLERATLYVARIKSCPNHLLHFGLSRPCSGCVRCINTFGIRQVVFSLDHGYEMLY